MKRLLAMAIAVVMMFSLFVPAAVAEGEVEAEVIAVEAIDEVVVFEEVTASAAAPAISVQPTNITGEVGKTIKFTITATGTGTLSYQWEYSKDGGTTWLVPGASSATTAAYNITLKDTYNGYKYRCKVTDSNGTTISKVVTLTVKASAVVPAGPSITTQPVNTTGDVGKSVKLTVAATGTGTLSYQWEYSKDGGTTWLKPSATSATTAAYNITLKDTYNGYKYRCKVTDSNGTTTTNVVTLTVKAAAAGPSITTQPVNTTGDVGKSVKLTVAATGTGTLSYQWEYSKDGGTTWLKPGATSATTAAYNITLKDTYNGYKYRCKVTDSNGTTTTNVVTLTVKAAAAGPSITTQPVNTTGVVGKSVKLTVAATGTGTLSYQWEYSKDGGTTWLVPGASSATTAAYNITLKDTYNGYKYRCKVTDSNGTTTTNVVTLTVKAAAAGPSITTQPVNTTGVVGKSVKLTVAATGTGTLSYQWEYSKDGGTTWVKPGATSATTAAYNITLKDTYNGYKYRCKVTDSNGTTTTNVVTLTVKAAAGGPTIKTQPVDVSGTAGEVVKLTVAATGTGTLSYQWEYSKNGGTTWLKPTATSAAKATYAITLKDTYNGYVYRCTVTDENGESTVSNVVTLTVSSDIELDDVIYERIDSATLRVKAYKGSASSVVIPQTVSGMTVVEIGVSAFEGNTNLKSIDLPDSITLIAKRAFANCTNLSEMN